MALWNPVCQKSWARHSSRGRRRGARGRRGAGDGRRCCSGGRSGRGIRAGGRAGVGGTCIGLGFGCCSAVTRSRGLCLAAAKIGDIPTRALELEASSRQLFLKRGPAAAGAISQRCIGDFLQNVLGKSAGAALVGVNRHGNKAFGGRVAKPMIIVCLVPEIPIGQGQRQEYAQYKTTQAKHHGLQKAVRALLLR